MPFLVFHTREFRKGSDFGIRAEKNFVKQIRLTLFSVKRNSAATDVTRSVVPRCSTHSLTAATCVEVAPSRFVALFIDHIIVTVAARSFNNAHKI